MRSKLPPTKIPCEVCGHILVERGDDGKTVLHERTEPCQHGCCRVHFCEGCGTEVSTTGWGAVGGAECACWGGTAASCRGEAPQ